MSLTVYPDLVQGSEEWFDQRRGMVTASVVGQLITPAQVKPAKNDHSRALTAQLVAERITGWTDPSYASDDMLRGHDDEPRAIDVYRQRYAPVVPSGFMVRDDWGFRIGCSPDGLVGDDGLIEIKSRRPKKHLQTILAGEVPAEDRAQIQCALLVSGRAWCDYLSYCGGMPMWRTRVQPDEQWAAAIVGAVRLFEDVAAQMIADYQRATEGLPATERVVDLDMLEAVI